MGSFVTNHIQSGGYAALILLGFLEACCIPISSEVTFGFAGVLAYQGHLNLALVIVIGSLAELAGSITSYYIGRAGGRPLVRKVGRFVLVTESDVDRAERFLEGRGAWAIPVGRMLPFVRAIVSIVAGVVRVPPVRFAVLSAIGTVLYAVILSLIGYGVGSAWSSVSHGLSDASYVIVAVVVVVLVAGFFYRLRQYRREQAAHAESGGDDTASGPRGSDPVSRPGGRHAKPADGSANAELR
ncbi:MAG TPA: DedA family protein [Streptosporangiaceae bacterium]|nr:DedA family protein [Streptosporangiaceae bacterium]